MKEYIFYSPKFEGEILFTYNEDGHLIKYEVKASLDKKQFNWLSDKFPLNLNQLAHLKTNKDIRITEVEPDLSFKRFWDEYGYKRGKLTQTENAWKRLTPEQKTRILKHIPIYKRGCQVDEIQMAYPSTYLNQGYWKY